MPNAAALPCQVLSKAMEVWGLAVIPLSHPEVRGAAQEPDRENAFICNYRVCAGAPAGRHPPLAATLLLLYNHKKKTGAALCSGERGW